ncbi:MAG: hypothetical protein LAO79_23285 [Acidobacteriia bacterium]|nr:hypothetical protein [Terriglobia bacterium]
MAVAAARAAVNRWVAIFFLAIVVLFAAANRPAYNSFFASDDLDNIANAREAELSYYAKTLVNPIGQADTVFRPVPAFYYWVMARTAGLHFAPYVAVIQLIHLLNVALVFFLARSLGATRIGACAASALFAFHAAMLTIYLRPMYVFDLVCATCILATLLAFAHGRLIASLVFFWLALKSKELAIFLPLALLAMVSARRSLGSRVKGAATADLLPTLPFFAISALFGISALLHNAGRDNDYSLRFTAAALSTCARFYASKLVLAPALIGFVAIAAVLLFTRNPLVRIGLATFVSLMLVLLVLPGRLYSAYLYCGFIGLALALSACARPAWLAVFFALWIPWNYRQFRIDRSTELAEARERAAWFAPVARFIPLHPGVDTYVYQNRPESLAEFGVTGAIKSLRPVSTETKIVDADTPARSAAMASPQAALLLWNPVLGTTEVMEREPARSFLELNYFTPPWQLVEGWSGVDFSYRWIGPHAEARLSRAGNTFEITAFVPDVFLKQSAEYRVGVSLNGSSIGTAVFNRTEPQTVRFTLPAGLADAVDVTFDVTPATGTRGLPIVSFGFK